jgi:hypothetical protein
MFQISRQSGVTPSQVFSTASGSKIRLTATGIERHAPIVQFEPGEGRRRVSIKARDVPDARRLLNQLKRKFPGLDVASALSSAQVMSAAFNDPINMQVALGGPDAGRAIVKSALALAVASGVNQSICLDAKRYLSTGEEACFGYLGDIDVIKERPPNPVFHCVAVQSTQSGLLLGYLELYTVFRMLICLSSEYQGEPVRAVYALDPNAAAEIKLEVDLHFSSTEVDEVYNYKRYSADAMVAALSKIIPEALRLARKREIERAVRTAWSALNLQQGEVLQQHHIEQLCSLITMELMPLLRR